MNKRLVLLFLMLSTHFLNAQIHEIGVFLGGSNYIGDVGKTNFINPNKIAFGLLYKWNKSPRHSYRFSYTQSTISGNDANSEIRGRQLRGYKFENSIKEFSAGLEFNFFDFNLHDFKPLFTPYVYSGLSYTHYDGLFFLNDKVQIDNTRRTLAIPMVVGVKGRIFDHLILGFEVGARYTFKDDLDGSKPSNKDLDPLKFGNINSTDWYVFSGFTLTYTFGNKPCYCRD